MKARKLGMSFTMWLHRGVSRYEVVVGHIIKPLLKSGGALCYQTTKKWWGTSPQAPPMVTTLKNKYRHIMEKNTLPICKKGTNNTFSRLANLDFVRKFQCIFMVHDFSIGTDQWLSIKWGFTKKHFIENYTHRPPIALTSILSFTTLWPQNLKKFLKYQ